MIGGLAIIVPTLIFLISTPNLLGASLSLGLAAMAGGSLLLGMVDDRNEISAGHRLCITTGLFVLVCALVPELQLRILQFSLFQVPINLGPAAIPFTVLCLVGFQNAVNMADGRNGLAIGMALVWTVLLGLAAPAAFVPFLVALGSALSVTMVFNLKGRLFLGDSGSFALSAMLGGVAVSIYNHPHTTLGAEVFALWFVVPVADCIRLIVTRVMARQSPFKADLGHFHHRLERLFTWKYALWLYLTMVAVPGAVAYYRPNSAVALLFATLVVYGVLLALSSARFQPVLVHLGSVFNDQGYLGLRALFQNHARQSGVLVAPESLDQNLLNEIARRAEGSFDGVLPWPAPLEDSNPQRNTAFAGEIAQSMREKGAHFACLLRAPGNMRIGTTLLRALGERGIPVKIAEAVASEATPDRAGIRVREVGAGDLFGQSPCCHDKSLIRQDVYQKSVFVTISEGPLELEVCRQALLNGASRLILFSDSEDILRNVAPDLIALNKNHDIGAEIITESGNPGDSEAMTRLMLAHRVETVYHFIGFGIDVPLSPNVFAEAYTRVLGTLGTLRATIASGANKFALISPNLAAGANTSQIAIKKACERVVQAIQGELNNINPLGGGGPVVKVAVVRAGWPIRGQQFAGGDAELPEASEASESSEANEPLSETALLILQASSISEGREIFTLNPDSGLSPDEIARLLGVLNRKSWAPAPTVTPIKSAAKAAVDGMLEPTNHPAIFRSTEEGSSWSQLLGHLNRLNHTIGTGNRDALELILRDLIDGREPADGGDMPAGQPEGAKIYAFGGASRAGE